MTREEAIDLLDNLIGIVEDNQENDYDNALKMAIEALKEIEKQQHDGCLNCGHFDVVKQIQWERDMAIGQLRELGYGLGEKIRTDGDTISRRAAIEALRNQMSDWNDDYNVPVRKSIENIERLPSAQRKKGRWNTDKESPEYATCSVCGHCDWDCTESEYFNYCPNCGAKMKGEEDETD